MADIKNVKLIIGRSSDDNKEFAQVSFDLSLSATEANWSPGYRLISYLYEINEKLDNIMNVVSGAAILLPGGADEKDQFVGQIFLETYHPQGQTDHIVRSKEWEFGAFTAGKETFRAVIAITPRTGQQIFPRAVISPEVIIDVD